MIASTLAGKGVTVHKPRQVRPSDSQPAAEECVSVDIVDVSHEFIRGEEAHLILEGVSLRVQPGEFLAIVGPSGCGKSTLLNLVAGLISPTSGRIAIGGQPVNGPYAGMGYVTQADGLLPWRTARANVELPLEVSGMSSAERRPLVKEQLLTVGLDGYGDYYPAQLSGGMRKRVTLARALVAKPKILLMDEPFSALDALLKLSLSSELLAMWRDPPRTVIYVTHDLVEAISLADRVVVMGRRPGRILEVEPVRISRPRDVARVRFLDEFSAVHERLWRLLESATGIDRESIGEG